MELGLRGGGEDDEYEFILILWRYLKYLRHWTHLPSEQGHLMEFCQSVKMPTVILKEYIQVQSFSSLVVLRILVHKESPKTLRSIVSGVKNRSNEGFLPE